MAKVKQLSLDDYNTSTDGIKLIDSRCTLDNSDVIEVEKTDYTNFSKEDLIKIIESKDNACENYMTVIETNEKKYDMTIKNLNDTYEKHVKDLNSLIKYYERKLKLISDLINIETGGEK